LSRESFEQIRDWVRTTLQTNRGAFENRVKENRIVDGHGDVRCEGVCIVDGITIFDCIEFNDRFRCGDLAGEIASLAISMRLAGPIWDMPPQKVTKPTRAIADYGVCFRSIAVTAPTYAARC
jgi:hypothetical protein